MRNRHELRLIYENYLAQVKKILGRKPHQVLTKQNYQGLKLRTQEVELIVKDLKIPRGRVLKAYQNLLIMNIKPAHPDSIRELKNKIKQDVSKVKAKIVKKAQKLIINK